MSKIFRWIPAILIMFIIFVASSTSSDNLPDYGSMDWFVKKGGHTIGYALLASAYWYAMNFPPRKRWLAWLLAFLYAASDEYHQSYTPGRHPSYIDILVFDGGGAFLGLMLSSYMQRLWRDKKWPF